MSHLLASECVSASFTVTTLSVIYTVDAKCLACWKQGCLCVQYAGGTLIIVVSLSLVVKERRKERLSTFQTVTRVSPRRCLSAGVCLSLYDTLNKENTHTCTRACAHTHTKSACVLSQNQHEWQLLYNFIFCWVQCHLFRFKGPVWKKWRENCDI